MSTRKEKERKVFVSASVRLVVLAIGFFLQIAFAAFLAFFLQRLSVAVMVLLYIVSFIAFIYVSARHDNPSTRPFWLLLIALFPGFGLILYFMWGLPRHGTRRHAVEMASQKDARAALKAYSEDMQEEAGRCDLELSLQYPVVWNTSSYLRTFGFPVFSETKITYLKSGEEFFADCLSSLGKAKKSIFLSFFILRDGRLWQQFYTVLCEKALLGVEIRLLLDDAGTMFNISAEFIEDLVSK